MSHIDNLVDELLKKFSRQEFRDFRYFISRRNNHVHDRKDLKYIYEARKNTLPVKGSNNTHQTKKRLKKQVEQFVQLENIRFDITSLSFNYIETATYLFRKQMPEHAWQYLLKAEHNALKYEDYVLLDLIYYVQIAYASNIYGLDLPVSTFNHIISKRNANLQLSILDANANAAYAEIKYSIRSLSHSLKSRTDIQQIIDNTLARYQLSDKLYVHPRVYGKIINIVSKGLAEIGAYRELAHYAVQSYQNMKQFGMLETMHPDYLNELLLSMCQSQLRLKNYTRAYCFLGMYKKRSQVFKHRYDKYSYHRFMQSLIEARILFGMGNLDEAENILLTCLSTYEKDQKLISGFRDLYLEFFAVYFCQHDMERCIRLYNKINRESPLNAAIYGLSAQVHAFLLDVFGVICYYHTNDTEYADELLKRIKRTGKDFLKAEQNTHYSHFIQILEQLLKDPLHPTKARYRTEVEQFRLNSNYTPYHKEYISLNAWLTSLLEQKSFYDCFLEEGL